jgi:hypothetical protein
MKMKRKSIKIILSTLLLSSSIMASDFSDVNSLVGIEGGYSSLDVEKNDIGLSAQLKKYNMYHGGLKIGAESENYRFFLSARYYNASDFDYAMTYGAELQYLFNISKSLNLYIGGEAGLMDIRFTPANEPFSRTFSEIYYGGDVGLNVHMSKNLDLEVGARVLSMDASNTINNVTYTFDNIVTGYASVIFKFQMD